jgi:hypothetical protein
VQAAHGLPGPPQDLLHGVAAEAAAVDREEMDEVVGCAAVLEHEAAVHVGLRRLELGIEEDLALHFRVREADRHVRPALPRAEGFLRAVVVDHGQPAVLDEAPQKMGEKPHALLQRGAHPVA